MSKMCNEWSIGAYYTKGPYEEIVKTHLQKSCTDMGLFYKLVIVECESQGSWYKNTALKPMVILDILDSMDKDLVFLDADATIEQYPTLFDTIPKEYDIAFHTLDWNSWYGYKSPKPVKELLSGTMFLRNNDKIKALCRAWYSIASKTNVWEQKVLQNILDNYDLKCYHLPIEYCFMKSRPRDKEPLIKTTPVILHYQASRTHKRGVL